MGWHAIQWESLDLLYHIYLFFLSNTQRHRIYCVYLYYIEKEWGKSPVKSNLPTSLDVKKEVVIPHAHNRLLNHNKNNLV